MQPVEPVIPKTENSKIVDQRVDNQPPQDLGQDSHQLSTNLADNPHAPSSLKSVANFLRKAATLPPAVVLKGVEYGALALFSVASLPAFMGYGIGGVISTVFSDKQNLGSKLGFRAVSIITSPILVPLAIIGLGSGLGGSTLKAISKQKDLDVWLPLHIARRANDLHEAFGDVYGIDFRKIALSFESKGTKEYAKKAVREDFNISFEDFKTKAAALKIPEDEIKLKEALRDAKIDLLSQRFTDGLGHILTNTSELNVFMDQASEFFHIPETVQNKDFLVRTFVLLKENRPIEDYDQVDVNKEIQNFNAKMLIEEDFNVPFDTFKSELEGDEQELKTMYRDAKINFIRESYPNEAKLKALGFIPFLIKELKIPKPITEENKEFLLKTYDLLINGKSNKEYDNTIYYSYTNEIWEQWEKQSSSSV